VLAKGKVVPNWRGKAPVAMRLLPADQRPDHDTIATFRQQHLE